MSQKKSYLFVLKNIHILEIDQKYGFSIQHDIRPVDHQTTKLTELNSETNTIAFLDENKFLRNCVITQIDYKTDKELKIEDKNICCFWDKHPLGEHYKSAIGCPIRHVPSQLVKKYYSELSKDTYTIRENISPSLENEIKEEKNKDDRMFFLKRDYYITDGIFCSFNCLIAWILENKHNNLYRDSYYLTLKIYNDLYNEKITSIEPSPSWRLLKCFGGYKSIDNYRTDFKKSTFKDRGTHIDIKCIPLATIFEEQLHF